MEDVPEEEEEEGGAGRMVWPMGSVKTQVGGKQVCSSVDAEMVVGAGEKRPCPGSARTEGVGATLQVIAAWC